MCLEGTLFLAIVVGGLAAVGISATVMATKFLTKRSTLDQIKIGDIE